MPEQDEAIRRAEVLRKAKGLRRDLNLRNTRIKLVSNNPKVVEVVVPDVKTFEQRLNEWDVSRQKELVRSAEAMRRISHGEES